jgi:putative ABC transport system permease protein
VAVVNRTLAERLWPGQDPLGRRLRSGLEEMGPEEWITVVGVVEDFRQNDLDAPPAAELYRPLAQARRSVSVGLLVRTEKDAANRLQEVRELVRAIDPQVPLTYASTLDRVLWDSLTRPRLLVALLGGFALLALFLGCLGVYGVVAHDVRRQSHDIGIRMALGARAADVLRLVLGRGVRLTAAGVALGLLAALALGRFLSGLLYEVAPTDPATLAVVSLLLAVAALAAAAVPARRATAVDPVDALRHD